jgi:hypothetical protein
VVLFLKIGLMTWKQCGEPKDVWRKPQLDRVDLRFRRWVPGKFMITGRVVAALHPPSFDHNLGYTVTCELEHLAGNTPISVIVEIHRKCVYRVHQYCFISYGRLPDCLRSIGTGRRGRASQSRARSLPSVPAVYSDGNPSGSRRWRSCGDSWTGSYLVIP